MIAPQGTQTQMIPHNMQSGASMTDKDAAASKLRAPSFKHKTQSFNTRGRRLSYVTADVRAASSMGLHRHAELVACVVLAKFAHCKLCRHWICSCWYRLALFPASSGGAGSRMEAAATCGLA